MPAPGNQYNSTSIQNPFEEPPPRISEYTAQEIATLQSRLDKQLGPEYISNRAGPGGNRVHYLAAEKAINLANQVFGFSGWSSQIKNVQIDYVDEAAGGRISLGLSIIVRVTLRNGVFHEDIGYGQIENARGKAAAFEKAKKEAATDALKRALRTFGNVLGNCLYDKDYLLKVTKIKAPPSKWDAENLHRHPDFAPVKKDTGEEHPAAAVNAAKTSTAAQVAQVSGHEPRPEQSKVPTNSEPGKTNDQSNLIKSEMDSASIEIDDAVMAEFEDEFDGGNLFDDIVFEEGYSDAIALLADHPSTTTATTSDPHTSTTKHQSTTAVPPFNPPSTSTTVRPQPSTTTAESSRQLPPQRQPQQQHEPPVGFITSRAAELLSTSTNPPNPASLPRFNPKAESPSIRKTSGVDHAKSAPIRRESLAAGAKQSPTTPLRTPQQQPGGNGAPSSSYTPTVGRVNSHGPTAARPNGEGATGPTMPATNHGYISNPSENPNRRIGMPLVPHRPQSPHHANTGLRSGTPYKVPRPHNPNAAPTAVNHMSTTGNEGSTNARQPLSDVSSSRSNAAFAPVGNTHVNGKEAVLPAGMGALQAENAGGGDVKRRRISDT